MLIKAGTYRFNDVLSASSTSWFFIPCNFIVNEPISTWDTNIFVGFHTYVSEDGYFAMSYAHTPPAEDFDYEMFGLYSIYNSINAWGSKTDDQNARTITIPNDSEVSSEFYEWFTANAVKNKEISGKWKFNDVLTYAGYNEVAVNFTAAVPLGDMVIIGQCDFLTYGYNLNIRVVSSEPDLSAMGLPLPAVLSLYNPEENNPWLYDVNYIDFGAEPQSVSADFYNWMNANAVEQKEISGKWKFKDEITAPVGGVSSGGVNFTTESLGYIVHCNDLYVGEYPEMTYVVDSAPAELEQYLGSLGITLPFPFHVVNGGKWDTDFYGEGVKTIDFGIEPQTVSAEFYNWLTANATELVDISGKWRFREVLTPPADAFKETVSFLNGGESFNAMYAKTVADTTGFGLEFSSVTASGGEILLAYADGAYGDLFAVSGWADDAYRTVDFGTESQAVSAEFYRWLTANAVPATATITHNGSTIAELFPGQTATLKCKGLKMEDDVVVAVGELPETEIPEPKLQEKTATENGEYFPGEGYVGFSKVTVAVESSPPVMQTLEVNITEPGIFEFTPDAGYDGIIKVVVGVDVPQLTAPTISLGGDTLTIEATDDNTEAFAIFVDGIEVATVANEGV